MLLRCGGNVVKIGRRQIAVVTTAAVALMIVSTYSLMSVLDDARRTDSTDRIHRKKDATQKKALKAAGGLAFYSLNGLCTG